MTYAVYLYKEGEPNDGEEYACGPFLTEEAASAARDTLVVLGSAVVLDLHPTAAELALAATA